MKNPSHLHWLLPSILAPALVLGTVHVYEHHIKDADGLRNWGVVVPGLVYRSGQLDSKMIEPTLRENSIELIINLQGENDEDFDQMREQRAAREMGIEFERYGMGGNGVGSVKRYVAAIASIARAEREQRPVLVHCAAGAKRTGGVIACYRMLVHGWSRDRTREEMQRYGYDPEDDVRLTEFLADNLDEITSLLRQQGVLEHE